MVPLLVAAELGCTGSDDASGCPAGTECVVDTGRCDDFDPLRKPLFGDTHIHTKFSFDANVRGTRLEPEGAYRFAKGEPIGIQPYDEQGNALRTIQRERPLDWVAISDHAEYLGTVVQCTDPEQPGYDHPQCEIFRGNPLGAFISFGLLNAEPPETAVYPALCGDAAQECLEAGMAVWEMSQQTAEQFNDETTACEFTSLLAYEWTGNPGTNNLHRNVIFRNDVVPDQVISYFDEPYIEDVWSRLRSECIDAETDCDALTIPHDSNLSSGTFFQRSNANGDSIDSEYAAERAFMEPLFEVYQHKGDSECLPGETISDEFCGFEKLPFTNFSEITVGVFETPIPRDYLRAALGEGMRIEQNLGANPFKHGIVASTDTHIAAPGHVSERNYAGHGNVGSGATATEFATGLVDNAFNGPGGLAVVWAEENSREAIFLAMRRKEAYGTSGPHMVVRFFGGWNYPGDMCDDVNFAQVGYDGGVPMGGDLPALPNSSAAPTFFLSALQDPGTENEPGTPLQRLQIIKGWLNSDGEYEAEAFDVGGNPDNGANVDLATCTVDEGTGGFPELCTTWTDPAFDPERPAFYYARVLENPVCRWSTWGCNAGGVDCGNPETITEGYEECCALTEDECADVDCESITVGSPFESCCRTPLPKTVQERAWTSPIWYAPAE